MIFQKNIKKINRTGKIKKLNRTGKNQKKLKTEPPEPEPENRNRNRTEPNRGFLEFLGIPRNIQLDI